MVHYEPYYDSTMSLEGDLLVLGRLDVRVVSWQSSVCHCCQVSCFVWDITSVVVEIILL